jgi:hypothetical protein
MSAESISEVQFFSAGPGQGAHENPETHLRSLARKLNKLSGSFKVRAFVRVVASFTSDASRRSGPWCQHPCKLITDVLPADPCGVPGARVEAPCFAI